jgi:hypothetical protein
MAMDSQNEKSNIAKYNKNGTKEAKLSKALVYLSLKDMPLEDRRKEAKKPLFLIRYE